jgi:SNF2 family DNA or RNA helicase
MRRLCGGFIDKERVVHNIKLDCLIELLEGELSGQKIVIWAHFVNEIEYVAEQLNCKVGATGAIHGEVKPGVRAQLRNEFQNDTLRYLVVQPKCFQYGQNLTAAQTEIYFSSPEGADIRAQSEDRIVDATNKASMYVLDIIMKDTIEEDIYEGHKRKESNSSIIARMVKGAKARCRK